MGAAIQASDLASSRTTMGQEMTFRTLFKTLTLVLAACSSTAATHGPSAPRGAILSAHGFATILDAPPAPYTPTKPGEPTLPTPAQLEGSRQLHRAGTFQNEVREEVEALAARLRVAEKGNFAELYYDNEGDPSVVFQFLRNGPETLRKYSSNPRFRGKTVRWTREQLHADMDWLWKTFQPDRALTSVGTGANEIHAEVAIPEQEWRALVARKGVKIPESVQLRFPASSAASVNTPLPARIAPLVRAFPRSDRFTTIVEAISSRAKVVLRDGCFRMPDQGDALVLFPAGAQLFLDPEGYLAFGPGPGPGYARVGEQIETPGVIHEVTTPALVEPIHRACGPGKVMKLNGLASAAAERAQQRVGDNFRAVRDFKTMYGLSDAQAQRALAACKKNMGFDTCLTSPPPPVRSQAQCPSGTKLSGGLCRTPEGYIRPLPKWLADLVR